MAANIGNFFVKAIVNSPLHPLLGSGMAVLIFEGRKTGKRYSTPINVVKEGNVFISTSLRSRKWWRNLRGGKSLTLRVGGKNHEVYGIVIEDEDKLIAGFSRYFVTNPKSAGFFGVTLDKEGHPMADDLKRIANERVFIKLYPAKVQ